MARGKYDLLLVGKSVDEMLELARLGRRAYDQRRREARQKTQMKYWARQALKDLEQQGDAVRNG